MNSVWNLGQNYVSNEQLYLISHLLSSSSACWVWAQPAKVLKGEEDRAAVPPQHLEGPTPGTDRPKEASRDLFCSLCRAGTINSGEKKKQESKSPSYSPQKPYELSWGEKF